MTHQSPTPSRLPAPLDDLLIVRIGEKGAIYVDINVWAEVDEIFATNPKEKGPMLRLFERWCDGHRLTTEQLRNEGQYHDGRPNGKEWRVLALKSFQLRLYGVDVTLNGRSKCFVGLSCDLKKQNQASKAVLQSTARIAGALMARGVK